MPQISRVELDDSRSKSGENSDLKSKEQGGCIKKKDLMFNC